MLKQSKLSDLVAEALPFRATGGGWSGMKCVLCNDYKDRAGFKLDGDTMVYNCFNCSTTGKYEEFSGHISHKMKKIITAYGIDEDDIMRVVNSAFFFKKDDAPKKITLASLTDISTATPKISLPPQSLKLGEAEGFDSYQTKLLNYLTDRKIDVIKYPFFFSMEERFIDRVIIPYYRNGQLIYWQARSVNKSENKRYDNAPVSRESVMFNMDELTRANNLPIIVTEGVFDAMMVNGVCLLGSKISEAKKLLLSKCPREKIFIIDKDKNGKQLAETVLENGWKIAFTPDGSSDINDSIMRFGKIWTLNEIMKGIPRTTDAARLAIKLNCR